MQDRLLEVHAEDTSEKDVFKFVIKNNSELPIRCESPGSNDWCLTVYSRSSRRFYEGKCTDICLAKEDVGLISTGRTCSREFDFGDFLELRNKSKWLSTGYSVELKIENLSEIKFGVRTGRIVEGD